MIAFIETWQSYSVKTDAAPRWYHQVGDGSLSNGGMLMQGSLSAFCTARTTPLSQIRLGFWHSCLQRPPSITNSSFLHLLCGGDFTAYNQIGLGMNPGGTVSVFYGKNFSGLGGLTLGDVGKVLDVGSLHWIELDVVVSTTNAGSVELRIDGEPEVQFTGIRTGAVGSFVDRLALCGGAGVSKHWFGGMYAGDGADGWLGPADAGRVPVDVPAGATAASGYFEIIVPRGGYAGAPPPPPPPAVISIPPGGYQLTLQRKENGAPVGDAFVADVAVSD